MKRVFEYIYWEGYRCPHEIKKDGNLMVLAINKMQEKGDWEKFSCWCYVESKICPSWYWEVWLFGDPANFFKLFEEWLNEKAD